MGEYIEFCELGLQGSDESFAIGEVLLLDFVAFPEVMESVHDCDCVGEGLRVKWQRFSSTFCLPAHSSAAK